MLAILRNALFSFSILIHGLISLFFPSHFILTVLLYVLYLFQIILLCVFFLFINFFLTFDSCTIWLFGRNKNRTPVKPATTIWQLLSESLRVTEGPAFGPWLQWAAANLSGTKWADSFLFANRQPISSVFAVIELYSGTWTWCLSVTVLRKMRAFFWITLSEQKLPHLTGCVFGLAIIAVLTHYEIIKAETLCSRPL